MTDNENENKHQSGAFEDALGSFQKVLETVVQGLESDSASTRQEAYYFLQREIEAKVEKILREHDPQLSSSKGIDYKSLKNFLSTGKWGKADEETLRIMLKISKREEKAYLTERSIRKFPSVDLKTIDQLWVKYSNGRFGFSVQKRIWQACKGDGKAFGKKIGWFDDSKKDWREYSDDTNWLYHDELTFNLKSPEGHLPVLWRDYMNDKGLSEDYYFDLFARVEL